MDGQTPEDAYTIISSPCEPDGSGELKMLEWMILDRAPAGGTEF